MRKLLNRLVRRTEAQDIIEYALLPGLISVVAYAAIQGIGGDVGNIFQGVNDQVVASGASAGGGTGGGPSNPGTGTPGVGDPGTGIQVPAIPATVTETAMVTGTATAGMAAETATAAVMETATAAAKTGRGFASARRGPSEPNH